MTFKQAIALFTIAAHNAYGEPIPDAYANRIADAIYRQEGGTKTRFPFGVKSGYKKTGIKAMDYPRAREVCLRTIRNNWQRWNKAGRPGDFIGYLGDRYCPPSADPVGNRRWKRNVKRILK